MLSYHETFAKDRKWGAGVPALLRALVRAWAGQSGSGRLEATDRVAAGSGLGSRSTRRSPHGDGRDHALEIVARRGLGAVLQRGVQKGARGRRSLPGAGRAHPAE